MLTCLRCGDRKGGHLLLLFVSNHIGRVGNRIIEGLLLERNSGVASSFELAIRLIIGLKLRRFKPLSELDWPSLILETN